MVKVNQDPAGDPSRSEVLFIRAFARTARWALTERKI